MKIEKLDLVESWNGDRYANLVRLAKTLAEGVGLDDIVREIVLEILEDSYRPLLAWLVGAILEAGHALDEALTWERIKNQSVREFFEDHDDIGAGLLRAISALSEAIAADAERVQGHTAEDLQADIAVDLLGGGRGRRFFRDGLSLRGRPITGVQDPADLPAFLRPKTEAAEVESETVDELVDEVETVDKVEAEAEVEETETIPATAAERLRSAIEADDAEAETEDRTSQAKKPTATRRRAGRRRVVR